MQLTDASKTSPMKAVDNLEKREAFAVDLRKAKKKDILKEKRVKLDGKLKQLKISPKGTLSPKKSDEETKEEKKEAAPSNKRYMEEIPYKEYYCKAENVKE